MATYIIIKIISYPLREDIIFTAKSISCAKMGSCVVAVTFTSAFAMLFVIAIVSVLFNSLIDMERLLA